MSLSFILKAVLNPQKKYGICKMLHFLDIIEECGRSVQSRVAIFLHQLSCWSSCSRLSPLSWARSTFYWYVLVKTIFRVISGVANLQCLIIHYCFRDSRFDWFCGVLNVFAPGTDPSPDHGRWEIMHPDSLLLWWPAQWCLWDFQPISVSYNYPFWASQQETV